MIFPQFLTISCEWGITISIIISEESWETFVLPLPCFDVFDSNHFLKNFESKIFVIIIYIIWFIILTIVCWLLSRWLERNWSRSNRDMKNKRVEAKNKNHFRVMRVGWKSRKFSLFLSSILIWRFMKNLCYWSEYIEMTTKEKFEFIRSILILNQKHSCW